MLPNLLGGLGIFLLGMVLLTDGLKSLAGGALRQILMRFVRGPLSGVGWGALVTALVQSSSATTLITVGFVSAGLMTFTQSVGVIFGVNLGTTSTGWIVSQLGFRVSLGSISPPLILLGVILRLLARGRLAHCGTALAGFGLLFVGIDLLQDGMATLAERMTPASLPGGAALGADAGWLATLRPRLILVGFGFLMTILMQSSSASLTTTLAAVAAGTINLEQAAALAIGQNIGTTPKAVAAAIGAPASAKRTAAAHVLFNLITGGIALALLPWLLGLCAWAAAHLDVPDAPTILALFHTAFNLLGVLLLLPVIGPFSRLIERLLPDRRPDATRFLANAVAEVGPVALEAARRSLLELRRDAALATCRLLGLEAGSGAAAHGQAIEAVHRVRIFVHRLGLAEQAEREFNRAQAALHACDHLERLLGLLVAPPEALSNWSQDPVLRDAVRAIQGPLTELARATIPGPEARGNPAASNPSPASAAAGGSSGLPEQDDRSLGASMQRASREVASLRRTHRSETLRDLAAGRIAPAGAMHRIELLLWLDGVAYHLWRATHHLLEEPPEVEDRDATAERTHGGLPPVEDDGGP